jgi:hypothetical protein
VVQAVAGMGKQEQQTVIPELQTQVVVVAGEETTLMELQHRAAQAAQVSSSSRSINKRSNGKHEGLQVPRH